MRQESDLQGLAVFAKVVDARSFSGAARAFGTTTSAVSKRVAKLEERLRVRLLSRTTRRIALTEAGAELYAHAVRIVAEVAEAEDAVAKLGGNVRGTLRVSAPVIFGERHVAALVPSLLAAHPDLRIEMSVTDRYVNLAEEGFDCAVRIGALGDSSLVAVRIGEVESAVCASPAYLAARGTPKAPHDLAAHECLRFSLISAAREWRFRGPDMRELSVPVTGRLTMNSGGALLTAAIAGAGVSRLPMFLVEEALARGDLVEVLAAFKTKPSPIHIMYASTPHVPPKLRVFVDGLRRSCTVGAPARAPERTKRRRS